MTNVNNDQMKSATVINGWVNTWKGHRVDLRNPDPDYIDIEDIAHGLSLQCRYNGQISSFYSVAEHSMYVSRMSGDDPEIRMVGLLHDAAEAYLGDIVSPLKVMLPEYKAIEENFERILFKKFDAQYPISDAVITADRRILASEVEQLVPVAHPDWSFPYEPYKLMIHCYTPQEAEGYFLRDFNRIMTSLGRRVRA